MATGIREELWNATFETFYAAMYNEVVSERIVARWQVLDDLSRVVIALTASGSAVAGWTLWHEPSYRIVWLVLAALGAVLSIIHSALGVPARLTYWADVNKTFAMLRNQLETFKYQMQITDSLDFEEYTKRFLILRKEMGKADQRVKPDLMAPTRLKRRWQAELNTQLGLRT